MSEEQLLPPQAGKFSSTVRVGQKGQIVIPKGARDLYGIAPGDTLMLLADEHQGIAILPPKLFEKFVAQAMPSPPEPPATPGEGPASQGRR